MYNAYIYTYTHVYAYASVYGYLYVYVYVCICMCVGVYAQPDEARANEASEELRRELAAAKEAEAFWDSRFGVV